MNKLNKLLWKIVIIFIRIYQLTISPDKWIPSYWLKWKICIHTPHCSKYSIQVLERYWFYPWIIKVMERVTSCHPWNNIHYDPAYYKVVFFSSAPIWIEFLKEINNDKRFELVWVVTQPDKPIWRWMKVQSNIIKQTAEWLWINDIITPQNINSEKTEEWKKFKKWLEEKEPDYIVVIAYWKIIPIDILDIWKFWSINVHWSILPKYRWASPLQSVFIEKEKESWITIMKMNEKMDEGNIIKILKFNLEKDWTVLDLIEKITTKWPKFLNDCLFKYAKWELIDIEQNNNEATYCKKINKEDWEISLFDDNLENIYSKYQWYYIWPKIHFFLKDKRFIIEKINIDKNKYDILKTQKIISKNLELNEAISEIYIKPEWKKQLKRSEFKQWYLKV